MMNDEWQMMEVAALYHSSIFNIHLTGDSLILGNLGLFTVQAGRELIDHGVLLSSCRPCFYR